jgi:hypothetical protein
MPNDLTLKPVAQGTIACPQLILVPSAKLVTMAGILLSCKPSALPTTKWDQAEPLDPPI